ncbi:MAG: EamA family transporter [bacterium]
MNPRQVDPRSDDNEEAAPSAAHHPWAAAFHLGVVYIVWGSTYLAIRYAVREGSGFPPFTMSGMRVAAAGAILLAWSALTRKSLRLSRDELRVLIVSGLLLWVGANGLVVWAEQRASSGYAALLVAAMPIWTALMVAIIDRRAPSRLLIASLLIGFAGMGVLSAPALLHGARADVMSTVALLIAPISWSAGSLLQQRRSVRVAAEVSSGYLMLFGGIGFAIVALLTREPLPTPTPSAWIAWAYLLVFGSLLGFTSFVKALKMLPTNVVMTYAYVNPLIAVLLGWVFLREPLTLATWIGTALILAGVAGVFRARQS